MPAFARVVIPDIPYHVTQRGNYSQDVFFLPQHRITYLRYVATAAEAYGLQLHGWCLMTNHVHWIVVPSTQDAMADCFRRAHSRYSLYINRHYNSKAGHLWQGRYYSCPLDNTHFDAALLYVERNPTRAGLVKAAIDYPWSSAAARAGFRPAPPYLHLDRWADRFSAAEWPQLLNNSSPDSDSLVRVCTQQGKPCGSGDFVQLIEQKIGRPLQIRSVGRPKIRNADGGSLI